MSMIATALEVKRDDLRTARMVTSALDAPVEVAAGRTVLVVDRFALTANNITYGAFGEQMSYWAFFPASGGYGRIPVWGFADVVATPAASGLTVGERVYGYFPMASHLVVEAGKVSPRRLIDTAAHRAKLPPVYNAYERVTSDPGYAVAREPAQMLLRPLVMTSYLIADFLDDNGLFGARQIILSSASSKTSLGLAYCLKKLARPGVSVVGLTSTANCAFVEATRQYDRVVGYDAITSLDAGAPSAFVDMAGSADVLKAVHTHLGNQLKYSCRVGGTHWEGLAGRMDLPGAKPVFFFAPSQIEKRAKDWGPAGLEHRMAAAWPGLVSTFDGWMKLDERRGADAVLAAYHETLEGRQKAETGLVLSLA